MIICENYSLLSRDYSLLFIRVLGHAGLQEPREERRRFRRDGHRRRGLRPAEPPRPVRVELLHWDRSPRDTGGRRRLNVLLASADVEPDGSLGGDGQRRRRPSRGRDRVRLRGLAVLEDRRGAHVLPAAARASAGEGLRLGLSARAVYFLVYRYTVNGIPVHRYERCTGILGTQSLEGQFSAV